MQLLLIKTNKQTNKLINENKNSAPGVPQQALPHPCHFLEEGLYPPP